MVGSTSSHHILVPGFSTYLSLEEDEEEKRKRREQWKARTKSRPKATRRMATTTPSVAGPSSAHSTRGNPSQTSSGTVAMDNATASSSARLRTDDSVREVIVIEDDEAEEEEASAVEKPTVTREKRKAMKDFFSIGMRDDWSNVDRETWDEIQSMINSRLSSNPPPASSSIITPPPLVMQTQGVNLAGEGQIVHHHDTI